MAGKFGRFIDTSGKTPEEIREEIKRLLSGAVNGVIDSAEKTADAVDETVRTAAEDIRAKINEIVGEAGGSKKTYSSQKIPPRDRENISYRTAPKKPQKTLSADEIAFAPDRFPVKITEKDRAINEKIAEMRRLNEIFYNGYLVQQCAERSIVKQGEFMADMEDDYEHRSFCNVPRPVYGALSNSQLRTYFTWRTGARRGVYAEADEPYVVLYCYELLNMIGVMSAADAFGRLLEIKEHYARSCPEIKRRLPRWLKDFYAYNDITARYPDISALFSGGFEGEEENDLYERRYRGHLDYFMRNSSYNLSGSSFFSEETAPLLDGALSAAWTALDGYFGERGLPLFELICGKMRKDFSWEPFRGAYVDLDRMEGFREVDISSVERYCVKRGAPALECFEAAPYRGFIGYVIKHTEAILRKRTGCRHPVTPNLNTALNDFANREKLVCAVNDPAFAETLDRAVLGWCDSNSIFPPKKERKKPARAADNYGETAPPRPAEVTIDIKKLTQIREEAEDIARRLIVEDESAITDEEITGIAEQIIDEDFSEQVAACADIAQEPEPVDIPPAPAASRFDFSGLPKTWRALAESLSETQVELLAALTRGTAEEFCRRYGIFPETVYEEINTAALDAMGDIVIEGGEIIPDYEKDIKKIVAAADV